MAFRPIAGKEGDTDYNESRPPWQSILGEVLVDWQRPAHFGRRGNFLDFLRSHPSVVSDVGLINKIAWRFPPNRGAILSLASHYVRNGRLLRQFPSSTDQLFIRMLEGAEFKTELVGRGLLRNTLNLIHIFRVYGFDALGYSVPANQLP